MLILALGVCFFQCTQLVLFTLSDIKSGALLISTFLGEADGAQYINPSETVAVILPRFAHFLNRTDHEILQQERALIPFHILSDGSCAEEQSHRAGHVGGSHGSSVEVLPTASWSAGFYRHTWGGYIRFGIHQWQRSIRYDVRLTDDVGATTAEAGDTVFVIRGSY